METVNNIATAAVNAVWGSDKTTNTETTSATKEPLSGVAGDTSKGEPYDAGNITTPAIDKQEPLSGVTGDTTKGEPYDAGNVTPAPSSADVTTGAFLQRDVKQTEPERNDGPPSTSTSVPSKDDDRSDDLTQPMRQDNHDNTGPQSAEPLVERSSGETGDHIPTSQDHQLAPGQNPAQAAGSGQNAQENPGAESQGTGEQHIPSTGLHADGGDFNASKPGAGQEAERLLEEKHIRHGGPDDGGNDESGKAGGKKGLGERIKAKFHKH